MKNNSFLENKAMQISIALNSNDNTISSLIGNISDLFSSPYKRDVIADNDIVKHLWDVLFAVFLKAHDNEVKFDAISAMGDIYTYQSNIGHELELTHMKEWREHHDSNNASTELIDCVDDILSM
ncbi:hypothetical protein [Morganella morganii]|uniref:hypothetical protein n=1 Tax=Morganella morganii TaxID=582 RepID=UPI00339C5901